MSATQSRLGSVGFQLRRTRSGAVATPGTRIVVLPLRFRISPESPSERISRATRFRPTAVPSRRSTAWISAMRAARRSSSRARWQGALRSAA
jgi:hypothetical protein